MPTLEERIAALEGRMAPDLREEMARMRQDMTRGFERLDDRMQRQLVWLVSMQLMTMLTVSACSPRRFSEPSEPLELVEPIEPSSVPAVLYSAGFFV